MYDVYLNFCLLPIHVYCMLFSRLLVFFQNELFLKILPGIPSECQTVWIQIRPDRTSGLVLVQTVCKGFQPTTLVGKDLRNDIGSIMFVSFPEYSR